MKKENCFFLGIVSRKHGFKGDVNIKINVSSSEEFKKLDHLFIEINRSLVPFFISDFRFKNNDFALVKFEDVNNDQEAQALIGKAIYAPLEFLPQNEADSLLAFIHFSVIDAQHGNIGKITNIINHASQNLFEIHFNEKEILIPIVENYIQKVDTDSKTIHLNTPKGLIDLLLE